MNRSYYISLDLNKMVLNRQILYLKLSWTGEKTGNYRIGVTSRRVVFRFSKPLENSHEALKDSLC